MRTADFATEVQKQRAETKEITGCTLLQCYCLAPVMERDTTSGVR